MQSEANTESQSHQKKADKPLKMPSRACLPLSVTEHRTPNHPIAGNIHLAAHTTNMQLFLIKKKLEPHPEVSPCIKPARFTQALSN